MTEERIKNESTRPSQILVERDEQGSRLMTRETGSAELGVRGLGLWLALAGMTTAWAGDTGSFECKQLGDIETTEGTESDEGGSILSFNVAGLACPDSRYLDCTWSLDPDDGSMGELNVSDGPTVQWRPPSRLDNCPPAFAVLELSCRADNGGWTHDSVVLTVTGPDGYVSDCELTSGGCAQTPGAWVLVPFLFMGGFRRRD